MGVLFTYFQPESEVVRVVLSQKQQNFADNWIKSGNATQAAIEAGYSEKYAGTNATKLLKNTNVKSYIDDRLAKIQSSKIVDQTEIMEFLSAIKRGEVTETVVTTKGDVIKNVPLSGKDRIKAAELLGKRYAMWTDKKEINANINPVQIVDDIPEDDSDG